MAILTVLSGFLRPPDCLACGAADAWPCCSACLPPEPSGPGPWSLAADPTVTMWALGLYGDALRAAVLAGKLRGQAAALRALGRRLGALLLSAGIGADLVTWIGARPARGLPRDHASQIAAGVAEALDLPTVDLLVPAAGRDLGRARADLADASRASLGRAGFGDDGVNLAPAAPPGSGAGLARTAPRGSGAGLHWAAPPGSGAGLDQAASPGSGAGLNRAAPRGSGVGRDEGELAGGGEPAGRVMGRPPPRVRRRLHGGRVLLVDDVATTGRTLAGAVEALRQAGARDVEVAVLGASGAAFGPPADRSSPAGRLTRRGPPR